MTVRLTILALAAGVATVVAALGATAQDDDPVIRGRILYEQYCGSCHGVDLEGQPGWRVRLPNGRLPAPPHDETGHTWHHADQDLLLIVRDGFNAFVTDYETDMPAFAGVLPDEEIIAILDFIKSTWPDRERQFQAARTAAWVSN